MHINSSLPHYMSRTIFADFEIKRSGSDFSWTCVLVLSVDCGRSPIKSHLVILIWKSVLCFLFEIKRSGSDFSGVEGVKAGIVNSDRREGSSPNCCSLPPPAYAKWRQKPSLLEPDPLFHSGSAWSYFNALTAAFREI